MQKKSVIKVLVQEALKTVSTTMLMPNNITKQWLNRLIVLREIL